MPMVPELPMTMLACARIGAVHSVVFAGFSADALAQRIVAANSAFLVSADVGLRGGKKIQLAEIVAEARTKANCEDTLKKVFMWERFHQASKDDDESAPEQNPEDSKVIFMDTLVAHQRPYFPPVSVESEDNLFILYTCK